MGLVAFAPAHASAAGPPTTTPAGTGGGCAANGDAISGFAKGAVGFGSIVRDNAPIADENALFFTRFCSLT
jgi:hypothetical protein